MSSSSSTIAGQAEFRPVSLPAKIVHGLREDGGQSRQQPRSLLALAFSNGAGPVVLAFPNLGGSR